MLNFFKIKGAECDCLKVISAPSELIYFTVFTFQPPYKLKISCLIARLLTFAISDGDNAVGE